MERLRKAVPAAFLIATSLAGCSSGAVQVPDGPPQTSRPTSAPSTQPTIAPVRVPVGQPKAKTLLVSQIRTGDADLGTIEIKDKRFVIAISCFGEGQVHVHVGKDGFGTTCKPTSNPNNEVTGFVLSHTQSAVRVIIDAPASVSWAVRIQI